MDVNELEFLKRLQVTFRVEAEEHIRALSIGLIEIEKTTEPSRRAEIIEDIFREVHSLKGAARSVNLKDIESICQQLEGTLSALKNREIYLSPLLYDLLLRAVDILTQLVSDMLAEDKSINRVTIREYISILNETVQAVKTSSEVKREQSASETQRMKVNEGIEINPDVSAPPTPLGKSLPVPPRPVLKAALTETVKIPVTKLNLLLFQAEEMMWTKLSAKQRSIEICEIQQILYAWKKESEQWKGKQDLFSRENLKWSSTQISVLINKVDAINQAFEQDQRVLKRMVDDHLEAMKQVLMLPISSLVEVFPRLVRDLANEQGKKVDIIICGTELEVDRRILEEFKDPLIHLVRNCIDHGIEKPDKRISLHKQERGTITLSFSARDSRQFEIIVSDDGAGIDVEHLRSVAVRMGIIMAETAHALSPQEILQLIFQSGISTSEIITNISGRGLGLAIVREKVEKLGGTVSVDSNTDRGTTFRLLLPLTLATFRGVLVRIGDHIFVLPTTNVERTLLINRHRIQTIKNRETIELDGKILSLVKLSEVLELKVNSNDFNRHRSALEVAAAEYVPVLILSSDEKRIAFQVEEIVSEEEVSMKTLGKQLSRVRNIAGATVLGTGKVVPVLNVADLIKSAVRSGSLLRAPEMAVTTLVTLGNILVADDSITSRTLLKNILEIGGYRVSTAVDGLDAFHQLSSGEFDLLVSDVDMPHISGFELTTRIRSDKKLSALPVVLVTSLESLQDREHGIEVGANAYIIKSSFDQSNLTEVINRLI